MLRHHRGRDPPLAMKSTLLALAVLAIGAVSHASPALGKVEPNASPPGTPQVIRAQPAPPSRRADALVVRLRQRSARKTVATAAMARMLPRLAVARVTPVYPAGVASSALVGGKG